MKAYVLTPQGVAAAAAKAKTSEDKADARKKTKEAKGAAKTKQKKEDKATAKTARDERIKLVWDGLRPTLKAAVNTAKKELADRRKELKEDRVAQLVKRESATTIAAHAAAAAATVVKWGTRRRKPMSRAKHRRKAALTGGGGAGVANRGSLGRSPMQIDPAELKQQGAQELQEPLAPPGPPGPQELQGEGRVAQEGQEGRRGHRGPQVVDGSGTTASKQHAILAATVVKWGTRRRKPMSRAKHRRKAALAGGGKTGAGNTGNTTNTSAASMDVVKRSEIDGDSGTLGSRGGGGGGGSSSSCSSSSSSSSSSSHSLTAVVQFGSAEEQSNLALFRMGEMKGTMKILHELCKHGSREYVEFYY